jgi:transcriptional regulator GlxA family with amidase domain
VAAERARYWRHAAVPGVDLLRAAPALVAAEAGFADQAHLTRHFKRVVGVPPGAYQRERG